MRNNFALINLKSDRFSAKRTGLVLKLVFNVLESSVSKMKKPIRRKATQSKTRDRDRADQRRFQVRSRHRVIEIDV